jgi:hypothetical protein
LISELPKIFPPHNSKDSVELLIHTCLFEEQRVKYLSVLKVVVANVVVGEEFLCSVGINYGTQNNP